MANDAAALVVALSASLRKFEGDMSTAIESGAKTVSAIEKAFEGMNPNAAGMIRNFQDSASGPAASAGTAIGLIIAGGIAAAVAGVATKLHSLIDSLAQLGDRSDDLRLPVNLLQALSVAADQARVPVKTLDKALDEFTKRSKQDTDDAEEFYKALTNIGAGFATAFKSADTQPARLEVLRKAFNSTTDEVKTAQLALQAFGTDNERVIAIFAKGGEGMSKYIDQVQRLGLAINENFVTKAQEAKSQISLFSRVLTDEFSSGVGELIPLLVSLLPYIERLGAVVRDALGALANKDSDKPAGTLRNELDALDKQIARIEDIRKQAASGDQDSLRSQVRKFFGLEGETLEFVDANIAELRKRRDEVAAILAAKEQSKPATSLTVRPAFKERPSLSDKGDDRDAFDTASDAIARHIARLTADAAAVGQTAAAHEQLRVEMRLLEAARQSDVEITDKQIAEYSQLRNSMSAQQALTAAGIKLTDEQAEKFDRLSRVSRSVAESLERNKTAFQGVNEALRFGGNQIVDVIDRATQKGAKFGDIMADVLRNLSKQLLQAAITGEGAFAKLFGLASQNGGVGGILGALFGRNPVVAGAPGVVGIAGSAAVPTFGAAEGTDNWRGGPLWVGERGREIVNLPRGSQVIPNDAIRGAGSGGNHSLSVTVNLDGAMGDEAVRRIAETATARGVRMALAQVPGIVVKTQAQAWRTQ